MRFTVNYIAYIEDDQRTVEIFDNDASRDDVFCAASKMLDMLNAFLDEKKNCVWENCFPSWEH